MTSAASDLKRHKALAWSAFWKLERLWRTSELSKSTKVKLFYTTCVTILLHGCESWMISYNMESKIRAFATFCYRITLNIKRKDHVPNTMMIYSMTNTELHITKFKIAIEVPGTHPPSPIRRACQQTSRYSLLYIPPHGKRKPRRPRTSYLAYIKRLLGYDQ